MYKRTMDEIERRQRATDREMEISGHEEDQNKSNISQNNSIED
jgi:hypothetical protein